MLEPGFQLFDDARNRRLPAARDRELLGDRGQLPLAQRVLPDALIAADNCRQFPARRSKMLMTPLVSSRS